MSPELPVPVAVAGNPNTGKSTLFNALTGATQQVGNYPGITVERRQGACRLEGISATLLDLPGTYSLAATSQDEQIVVDVLAGRAEGEPRPRAVICVADASNLRRNLFLASQIGEMGLPVVVALNMSDEALARGIRVDAAALSKRLGVPVVPTVATKGEGMHELGSAVARVLREPSRFAPPAWPEAVREALRSLAAAGSSRPERDLFDLEPVTPPSAAVAAAAAGARAALEKAEIDPVSAEAVFRYRHLEELLKGLVTQADPAAARRPYAIDRFLTHRVWGLLVFCALMFSVFASIYWLATPLTDGIEWVFARIEDGAGGLLESRPMLQSLVTKGVVAGVGGVVVFLPQILILFFFVAVLEDTGYMARAAFLMDKVFGWTGLNGKSFVPMLSGFACAVPAVMSARTIEDPKARLSTILVTPLMSCSARLPVYVLLIGAFIEPRYGKLWAGTALFAMHLLGLVVAIPVAFLINRFLLKLRSIPFILEMPPYRRPSAATVFRRILLSGREFVVRAGTVIFAISILIWALTYFPRPDSVRAAVAKDNPAEGEELDRQVESAYLEQSLLGRFGKSAQPFFAPAGFDWKMTVGVLAAFPAREVIVSTLGILYAVEEDDENEALRGQMARAHRADGTPVYTAAVALAVMVFFAFCMQCGSTVAVMAREAGWRWASFAFAYMTGLAWLGAVLTYQVGRGL
jgi:ferrous iron transport protein B